MIRVLLFVSLWAALPAQALDFTRISSERAFRSFVVDRVLIDAFGMRVELGQNGSLTGTKDSARLRGGWSWDQGAYCRRLVIGQIDQGTECYLVYLRATTLVLQANRGRGNQSSFTIYAKR